MFHIDTSAKNPHIDVFLLHTLITKDKVLRYGENDQVDFTRTHKWCSVKMNSQ